MPEEPQHPEPPVVEESEQVAARREKLLALRAAGQDPFLITHFERTHEAARLQEDFAALAGQAVRAAGRITALRRHGKATFADLQDGSGRVQLLFRTNTMGEEAYARASELDLGDIAGAAGTLIRTRTGEVSIEVTEVTLLAKAMRPLPEKWHGLRDVEQRYRHRYLDLIANEEARRAFEVRSKVVSALRRFLDGRGFLEVDTPVLQGVAGGALARPFITHHNALDLDLYLRIATELHLKRLIVGGMERVYEVGRVFRNEGISTRHNPEYTLLEAYQAYADYREVMELTEQMVAYAAQEALGSTRLTFQGQEVDVAPPWQRIGLLEAIAAETGAAPERLHEAGTAREVCAELGLPCGPQTHLSTMVNNIFEDFVQPKLIAPTFVVDYPTAISPLAKAKAEDPSMAERFEFFICGMELGNAFSELNDPDEQRRRFEAQAQARAKGDMEAHPMDEEFVRALEYGMPPTGGLGLGVDRLVMLFTDSASIREVILFPQLRPEGE